MENKVKSPLTGGSVVKIREIEVESVKENYLKYYGINVESYFKNINKIQIFECLDTGYQFYYPFNIIGDSLFYEKLEKEVWYYNPWKWEHKESIKYIKKGDNVLEIGCGRGAFLEKIRDTIDAKVTGLELNENVTKNSSFILNQTIEKHAQENPEKYDVVCSFHVLEHISDVKSFLTASLKVLKESGTLIIAVPNNNSFIKDDFINILNMPPHHQGLWTKKSLASLDFIFNTKTLVIKEERLQKEHQSWFLDVKSEKYKFFKRIKRNFLFKKLVKTFRFLFKGQTIIATYKK